MKLKTQIIILLSCLYITLQAQENDTVTDVDGNVYTTVEIGNKKWFAENLKTTTYKDGTPIPTVTNDADWEFLTTPALCWFNNDSSYLQRFGCLYNWYVVNTQNLCPTGWHVATDKDWEELEIALGMDSTDVKKNNWRGSNQGNQLKADTSLWINGILGDSTSFAISGFKAMPGGIRGTNGGFDGNGAFTGWWTATTDNYSYAIYRKITSYGDVFKGSEDKRAGYSIRCVNNE